MSEKIEAFWQDATADDVAGIANTRKSIQARFRDEDNKDWLACSLVGWKLSKHFSGAKWIDAEGAMWDQCQVYREPAWYANKPDPGPGWRLLEKLPDEPKLATDEAWQSIEHRWDLVRNDDGIQAGRTWYRRRIEQLLSGHRWLVSGDRLESGDLYYEKGVLLEVGHEYWGNKVMLAEAFMRKIEQPKPEPVEPKFAVGQTVKVVGPKEIPALEWSSVGMAQYAGTTHTVKRVELLTNPPGIYYHLGEIDNWAFREDYLEAVEPEPKHYVLRVGDSVETPRGHLINVVSSSAEQRIYSLDAGDKLTLPNGQTITITAKGFEVTQ
jgi:hypothetical protein